MRRVASCFAVCHDRQYRWHTRASAVDRGVAAFAEYLEQADELEDTAHPSACAHYLQDNTGGSRRVVGANQLADSRRIDSLNRAHVQHDMSLPAPEERVNVMLQHSTQWRAERAAQVEHASPVRTCPADDAEWHTHVLHWQFRG